MLAALCVFTASSIEAGVRETAAFDMGNWHVKCECIPKKACDCIAWIKLRAEDNPASWLTVWMARRANGRMHLSFRFPRPSVSFNRRAIGGFPLIIDGKHLGTFHLNEDTCDAAKCEVRWNLRADDIVRLSKARELECIVKESASEGYGVPIPLDGFAEVFLFLHQATDITQGKVR